MTIGEVCTYPLIEDIDFWINLPVAVNSPGVGVSVLATQYMECS